MRTRMTRLGLLAAPLLVAQCAPACVPVTPPARPAAAVFGCVDGSTVHWWLNSAGALPPTRDALIDHRVTASVDGVPYADPVTIGLHPETSIAHFHGSIDARAGSDVDLAVSGPDGVTDLRADDLRGCPVAFIDLIAPSVDCAGELSVQMSLTVEGGQFSPPPQAKADIWAQVDQASGGPAPQVVRLLDPSSGPLNSGTVRTLTASGLDPDERWTVWASALPVALNGIAGAPSYASDWPVATMTVAPAEAAC